MTTIKKPVNHMNVCIDCKKECKKQAKRCITCSNTQNHYKNSLKNQVFKPKPCVVCEGKFVPVRKEQITCSSVCKEMYKNRLINARWTKEKVKVPKVGKKAISEPRAD